MISQVVDFYILQTRLADVINTATKIYTQSTIFPAQKTSFMCPKSIQLFEPDVNENFIITVLPTCFLLLTFLAMYEAIRTKTSFLYCFLIEIVALPWTIAVGLVETVGFIYSLFKIIPISIHIFIAMTALCTVHTGGFIHA